MVLLHLHPSKNSHRLPYDIFSSRRIEERGFQAAVYHGVDHTCNGYIYRLGVMLLDLENPARIIARGGLPVLWPEKPYEMLGRVANVTFTCNAVPEPDGTVKIYYGAADTCVGLAAARLDDLIAACRTGNPTAERFFRSRGRDA